MTESHSKGNPLYLMPFVCFTSLVTLEGELKPIRRGTTDES